MEVVILRDPAAVATYVADAIDRLVRTRPDCVLGLATGSSPLGVYAELARRHRDEGLSFAGADAFMLDEYIGLPVGHPESYRQFITTHFIAHVDIDPARVRVPGEGAVGVELVRSCADYEAAITAAGGVDLQLLGIGGDGHLGFNEPVSSLSSRTRIKTLTDQTRHDNARFFASAGEVPRHVITQGIGTILDARHLVLIATGEAKAEPIAAAVEGPLAAICPASALQLHAKATVVIDEAAAVKLRLADYYRTTHANRPAWQV